MWAGARAFNPESLATASALRYKYRMGRRLRTPLLLLVLLSGAASVPAAARVIWRSPGETALPLISLGAQALEAGKIKEGIELTQQGLARRPGARATAIGLANLCAGFALLKRWDEALTPCNRAISLDPLQWRPYNNRAAVFSARAQYDLAMADVERGLTLAPDSPELQRSLQAIRESKRVHAERLRTARPA